MKLKHSKTVSSKFLPNVGTFDSRHLFRLFSNVLWNSCCPRTISQNCRFAEYYSTIDSEKTSGKSSQVCHTDNMISYSECWGGADSLRRGDVELHGGRTFPSWWEIDVPNYLFLPFRSNWQALRQIVHNITPAGCNARTPSIPYSANSKKPRWKFWRGWLGAPIPLIWREGAGSRDSHSSNSGTSESLLLSRRTTSAVASRDRHLVLLISSSATLLQFSYLVIHFDSSLDSSSSQLPFGHHKTFDLRGSKSSLLNYSAKKIQLIRTRGTLRNLKFFRLQNGWSPRLERCWL